MGNRNLCFSDITSSLLIKFEEDLKSQRSKCGIGNMSDSGVRLYMSKIQALFNRTRLECNDEDAGIIRISDNPFAKYKIPKQLITRKHSLTNKQIRAIKEYRIPENMLGVIITRDVFLMSFFMVGMNTVDMTVTVKGNEITTTSKNNESETVAVGQEDCERSTNQGNIQVYIMVFMCETPDS